MTRDEIVDFLEWAQDCGQLQFPESRKVDMAEMYIKEQEAVNKKCNIPHVSNSVCDCCVPRPEDPFEYDNPICEKCGLPIKQTDC